MKKIISVLLSLITILSILSINVFAQENITELQYSIDEETIEDVYGIDLYIISHKVVHDR